MEELRKEDFIETIQGAEPVLIDFWSPGCEPCKRLMPSLERLAEEWPWLQFYKVNVQSMRRLVIKEGIMGVPRVRVYRQGEVLLDFSGEEVTVDSIKDGIAALRKKMV